MYYLGTVVLGMSDEEFWRTQPKRLIALLRVHEEVTRSSSGTNVGTKRGRRSRPSRLGYIDQVL